MIITREKRFKTYEFGHFVTKILKITANNSYSGNTRKFGMGIQSLYAGMNSTSNNYI